MVDLAQLRCGHCKKLTPIYDEAAKELHEAGSTGKYGLI